MMLDDVVVVVGLLLLPFLSTHVYLSSCKLSFGQVLILVLFVAYHWHVTCLRYRHDNDECPPRYVCSSSFSSIWFPLPVLHPINHCISIVNLLDASQKNNACLIRCRFFPFFQD